MSDQTSRADLADNLARRRARVFPLLALFLLIQQAANVGVDGSERLVDHVRMGAWVLLSLVILVVLTSGGFLWRGRTVRDLLNDEGTRANRGSAFTVGFIVAMTFAIVLYVMQGMWQLTTQQAIHYVVTAGLAPALIRFGWLERRDLA